MSDSENLSAWSIYGAAERNSIVESSLITDDGKVITSCSKNPQNFAFLMKLNFYEHILRAWIFIASKLSAESHNRLRKKHIKFAEKENFLIKCLFWWENNVLEVLNQSLLLPKVVEGPWKNIFT